MTTVTMTRSGAPVASPELAKIPFSRLLRVELGKTVGTRAARWLLAASVLAIVGGLAVALVFAHDIRQSRASYLSAAALGLTRVTPILLLMALTGEWSQRTAMVTFTQEPRRGRVLAAKALVGTGLAVLLAVLGCLAAQAAVLGARAGGRDVSADFGRDWPRIVGFLVFVVLISLVGMAFGALVHNTAAAIVAFFALGGLANLFSIGALRGIGHWVNTGQTYGWILEGRWSGHGAQMVVSSLLWIGLPLALGARRTLRREVR
jgi:hypothetical protein